MQLKTLLSGAIIYLLASMLSAGLPFFLLPVLTRYLTPAEFALMGIFQWLYTFFLATYGLSTAGAIMRQTYDVVDIAVADGAVLALPVINRAQDGLNFLRLQPQLLPNKFCAPFGAEHKPTLPVLVGFTFPYQHP